MQLGYDQPLFILAFDHRGSFQKKFFGIEGDPTPEQVTTIADAKHLIFEGLVQAIESGSDVASCGALIDEQFGSTVPAEARARGVKLAMPVERSGQPHFDFEYGDEFRAHIERFQPDFSKVLVRYNPEGSEAGNREQVAKLKLLSDWLRDPAGEGGAGRPKFLFELLVPAEEQHLSAVGGDTDRYDAELRPDLMRRAIAEIQDAGVEVDIWKIEGVEERSDCEMLVAQARSGGRDGVACVVLGRGADDAKVDHWLRQAAPVDGFIGFAIGRSIWWDPLRSYLDEQVDRAGAAKRISDNYLRFRSVYEDARRSAPVS